MNCPALLYDVPQGEYLMYASSSFPKTSLLFSQLFVDSCFHSSQKVSTEKITKDGQQGDFSPVVTILKASFLRELYNKLFSPIAWDLAFFPDGLKEICQSGCRCFEDRFQHLCMDGVNTRGFSRFHGFDCLFDF